MIKHCSKCDDYGEVVDPNAKCKCGVERIICTRCNGDSNPRIMIRRLETKVEELSQRLQNSGMQK